MGTPLHCCFLIMFLITCVHHSCGQKQTGASKNKLTTLQALVGGSRNSKHGTITQSRRRNRPPTITSASTKANTTVIPGNRLFKKLTTGYRKEVLPSRPVVVRFDLLLVKVKNTIEKEGIFETVVALFIEWHERRMVWNPEKYDNISMLIFHPDKVWVPDIAMLNSADHPYEITRDDSFMVRLTNDGTMKYIPTGLSRSWCHLQLLTFPFDIQTCSFEFESWSMGKSIMEFDNRSEALSDQFFASAQWTLCQRRAIVYEHVYNFTSSVEVFSRIRFDFVVRRKSAFYIVNLIFPCATLSLVQLLAYVIPSKDAIPDRTGFGMVNILSLVVFQTIIMDEMPKSSDSITSLSDYVMALIIMSAAGIFHSVLVERIIRNANKPPPALLLPLLEYVPQLWQPMMPKSPVSEEETKRSKKEKRLSSFSGTKRSSQNSNLRRRSCASNHDSEPSEWLTVVVENDDDISGEYDNVPPSQKLKTLHVPPTRGASHSLSSSNNNSRRVSFVEVSGGKIVSVMPMASFSEQVLCKEEQKEEHETSFSLQRRRSTIVYKSASVPDFVQGMKMARLQNGRAWATVANRLDALLFLICLPLSIALPLGLFLPLLAMKLECPLQEVDVVESIY